MAKSIYERKTASAIPPPEFRERAHQVIGDESLISIATFEYTLEEYDANLWREIGLVNGVENPFTFAQDFNGDRIRIPARKLPDFNLTLT